MEALSWPQSFLRKPVFDFRCLSPNLTCTPDRQHSLACICQAFACSRESQTIPRIRAHAHVCVGNGMYRVHHCLEDRTTLWNLAASWCSRVIGHFCSGHVAPETTPFNRQACLPRHRGRRTPKRDASSARQSAAPFRTRHRGPLGSVRAAGRGSN